MSQVARISLWGRTIGAVALEEGAAAATFEYDPSFARSGIEVSPLTMPLSPRVYSFPELSRKTYYGLPGFLADSLPDKFGNALIDTWLATQNREPDSFNVIERLCYTGQRGMGALEFAPEIGPKVRQARRIQVDRLVDLASEILTNRNNLKASFETKSRERALTDILKVGTSAGGARAKAVVAWNSTTNEVRSGQVAAGQGFAYWLLKFDGVAGNKDKELEDPKGYGLIEYAYYKMARDCGIEISECRLFEENGRQHFMTRRFDRLEGGQKLHMQSLCALAHYDFNLAGAYSYEQALLVIRKLGLPMQSLEEQFRRMVFNIIGRNQDDHAKNIAFLMNKRGEWSLSPAFDMTYSFNPSGLWTSSHQMTLNEKSDDFVLDDFKTCAKAASMKRGRAETIIEEVRSVITRWREYADEVGVNPGQRDKIQNALRLDPFSRK
ncbi:MAG: type II toxin-antitoxin system HipA family toxin [Gammaproteobacteria bacterium]|nr:MAG: type II toxin-antitoxin system HipA family toxin [Gammaproteobacteria bacterium]RLA37589.1 MAG: type II toxin-antitoxin system HipA family toxin [Gammaproteobacteria bacterium]